MINNHLQHPFWNLSCVVNKKKRLLLKHNKIPEFYFGFISKFGLSKFKETSIPFKSIRL